MIWLLRVDGGVEDVLVGFYCNYIYGRNVGIGLCVRKSVKSIFIFTASASQSTTESVIMHT